MRVVEFVLCESWRVSPSSARCRRSGSFRAARSVSSVAPSGNQSLSAHPLLPLPPGSDGTYTRRTQRAHVRYVHGPQGENSKDHVQAYKINNIFCIVVRVISAAWYLTCYMIVRNLGIKERKCHTKKIQPN